MQTALSPATVSVSAPRSNRLSAPSQPSKDRSPKIRVRFDQAHARHRALEVSHAIQGNHLAIQGFLQRVLHRPSSVEFSSATLRPGYDASERLIIRNHSDRSMVAHVQLEPQTIRFGRTEMPVVRLRDLAVLPEHRQQGLDDRMMVAAEAEAKRCGAMLMISQGEDFRLLRSHGWCTLGNDPVSIVSPQGLMGRLPMPEKPVSPFYEKQVPRTALRIGRLTDLESLQSLYDRHQSGSHGSLVRSTERWTWLVSKQAHDRIFLFAEGDTTLAYVVVRGASVMELIDITDDRRGSARLLERVAADAIDQGRHTLRIHAPLTDSVHHWADLAGGQVFAAAAEDSWMVKILSMRKLLRRVANELHRRRVRELSELSIRIGGEELLIRQGVRSMKITRGSSGSHRLGLTTRAAAQLFLGYRTADELAEHQQLVASSEEAMNVARQLFPALMLWRNRWDDMPL